MKVYSIHDKRFKKYGFVLTGYDFAELFENLGKIAMPASGITYVASEPALEACAVAKEMEKRGFGGMPIQLGYVTGSAKQMNGFEYHKCSEYNIPANDIILLLGMQQDIEGGTYDSSKCEAFLVPGGTGVELYGTTLHYAPLSVSADGYRMVCVLPRGTNAPKVGFTGKTLDDAMCFGTNKWFMAHAESPEVSNGAYVGVTGKNINIEDLEI